MPVPRLIPVEELKKFKGPQEEPFLICYTPSEWKKATSDLREIKRRPNREPNIVAMEILGSSNVIAAGMRCPRGTVPVFGPDGRIVCAKIDPPPLRLPCGYSINTRDGKIECVGECTSRLQSCAGLLYRPRYSRIRLIDCACRRVPRRPSH